MKTIKSILIAALILVGEIGFSQGGNPKDNQQLTPEEKATKRTEQMKKELSLSEDQTTKIYAINLAHIVEMEKLKEEQRLLKEKMKAERESTRLKIKEVLTPEQNVIFDQKAEEQKQKHEERKKAHQQQHQD